MILKSNPIKTSSGSEAIFHHLVEKTDENEHILLWKGRRQDVDDCIADATAFRRMNAVQHFQISSKEKLTDEQFADCITMLAKEFGFTSSDVCLAVIHTKTRHDGLADNRHCQFLVRTTHAETGKVLDVSHRYERQEKVARLFELKHGLELTKGRHNRSVYHAVPEEFRDRLKTLCDGPLPNSCLSDPHSKLSQRQGASPFEIKYAVREMFSRSDSWQAFEQAVADQGWTLEAGQKKPDVLILKDQNGVFVGSLSRLLGLKKAELQQFRTDPEVMTQKGIASPGPRDTSRDPTGKGETPVDPEPDQTEETHAPNATETGTSFSIPLTRPDPQSHWLGPVSSLQMSPRAVITEGMSHAEIQSVIDFNRREAEHEAEIRDLLQDQKRFADMLLAMMEEFDARWSHLAPEPFADPQSRDAQYIGQTHHARLAPARRRWLDARQKSSVWNRGNRAEIRQAEDAFTAILHAYGYDRHAVGTLDMQDDEQFAYALRWMADWYATGREKAHTAWADSPEVQTFLRARADMERLVTHLGQTRDVGLLVLARDNPEEALRQMAMLTAPSPALPANQTDAVRSVTRHRSLRKERHYLKTPVPA